MPSHGLDEALTSALLDHGVPKEAVQARVRIIKDKCNPESLKDALQDADKFWPRLKEVANDARVRLVTSQELADWKKTSAQKPPASVNNRPTKKVKFSGPEVRADLIDVSMEHFKVGQEGLAIMNASEARLAMKQQVRSCGALAILVVGSDLKAFPTLFRFQRVGSVTDPPGTPCCVAQLWGQACRVLCCGSCSAGCSS